MNRNQAPVQDPDKHADPDLEIDLDRAMWDPLYRRHLISRLVREDCEPGDLAPVLRKGRHD